MNTGVTTIEVDLAAAAILQALKTKAEAKGVSLGTLLLPLAEVESEPAAEFSTPAERAKAFRDWVKHHSVKGVIADDSRESIYTREDEAL